MIAEDLKCGREYVGHSWLLSFNRSNGHVEYVCRRCSATASVPRDHYLVQTEQKEKQ